MNIRHSLISQALAVLVFFNFLSPEGSHLSAQEPVFDLQDTLRGSITPERAWWDLNYYHLQVEADPSDSSLKGSVLVQYRVLASHQLMQIDLQPPMQITAAEQDDKPVPFERQGNVYYLTLPVEQEENNMESVVIHFGGTPVVSSNPPWDGGLVWRTDDNGNP